MVLIQRAPPWEEFVLGATISSRTEQLTRLEKRLAEERDLRLFLAVDPTDPADRSRLAGLPEDLQGAGFDDPDVRAAFVAYAKYLALNYHPAYLALGIEVDLYYAARGETAFQDLLSLYTEAYDAVKAISEDTLVFPTFQYENMLGILGAGEARQLPWDLVQRFEPRLDLLAVSSYPGLVFEDIDDMPEQYYSALQGHVNKPVALVSVGWSSSEASEYEGERQIRQPISQGQRLRRLHDGRAHAGLVPGTRPLRGARRLRAAGTNGHPGRRRPRQASMGRLAGRRRTDPAPAYPRASLAPPPRSCPPTAPDRYSPC